VERHAPEHGSACVTAAVSSAAMNRGHRENSGAKIRTPQRPARHRSRRIRGMILVGFCPHAAGECIASTKPPFGISNVDFDREALAGDVRIILRAEGIAGDRIFNSGKSATR